MTDVTAPPSARQVPTAVAVALAAVVVLMVAGGAWWWLTPGEGDLDEAATAADSSTLSGSVEPADTDLAATTPVASDATSATEELGTGQDTAESLETFQVVLRRDPFRSVRPETTEASTTDTAADGSTTDAADAGGTTTDAGGTTADVGGTTPDVGSDDPTTVPAPVGGSGEEGRACRMEGALVCDGSVVSVVEVLDPPGAIVEVDAVRYAAMVGDSFAERYRLLSVEGECGLIQYGDETFRQCVGAAALLK